MVKFTKKQNDFDENGNVISRPMEIVEYENMEAAVYEMEREFFDSEAAREFSVQKNANGGIMITIYNVECKIIKRLKNDC